MTEADIPFSAEIGSNMAAERAPATGSELRTDHSLLEVRHRGCFVVGCELTSPETGDRIAVLHADPDSQVPKLTASHVMMPVGPSEGIGGQHGFPRWADYHLFPQDDGPNGEKYAAFQAERSDTGLGLSKVFKLTDSSVASRSTAMNSEPNPVRTSLGEHYYFALADENPEGLTVNGQSLDELLGEGAQAEVMSGQPLFWPDFEGAAEIAFPAGHTVQLSAALEGSPEASLGMLIWHRRGNPSICFEPTAGFDAATGRSGGLAIPPYDSATLSTKIEIL